MNKSFILIVMLIIHTTIIAMKDDVEQLTKYCITNEINTNQDCSLETSLKKIATIHKIQELMNSNQIVVESIRSLRCLSLVQKGLHNLDNDLSSYIALAMLNLEFQGKTKEIALINSKKLNPFIEISSLSLINNSLTELPERLCELTSLVALDLAGNQLISLPDKITQLSNLRTLRLDGNPSLHISDVLALKLKNMPLDFDSIKGIENIIRKSKFTK